MRKTTTPGITTRANLRQAYVLLLLGAIFLLAAWLLKLNPLAYPLGILCFGLGMLVASLLNPARLVIAACLTTALGVAVFLAFRQIIPGNQILSAYIFENIGREDLITGDNLPEGQKYSDPKRRRQAGGNHQASRIQQRGHQHAQAKA